ncbi:MAG: GPI inositol-deacylase [Gammaproteobacteria bacterium]|nr:GPI inositol-deacylase [Gammaproteobacteria bacterium]MBU0849289.1 GPI inositol-deacylase [Gammaproteobacteria bacterium]MBU1267753.1 GPI inositol-deacylase [Gammaproteobacteria bacterium]MBU1528205.1 GPI inositol-deacylase [Gammaproteobacteria bacterium]MBU1781626.1 GPI inositol-deacylase [Gammaproteobacteria bacterium]
MTRKSEPTTGEKLEGTLMLVGDTIAHTATRVHEFHRAISDMPFKAVGTATLNASKPVEEVHNEITDLVYSAVREAGKGVFSGAAWVVRQANQSLASPQIIDQAMDDKRVSAISSAINGVFGDHLAATRNPMQVRMNLYANGQALAADQAAIMAQLPNAQNHLVIFLHGLCCNENSWQMYYNPSEPATRPYGDKLEEAFPVTALYLRYNTGRNIDANSRQFKRILNRLVRNWPVAVESITLVGHSMGGLISRTVVETLTDEDIILQRAIRDVVCLGSPHAGAPLARLAAAGEQLFDRFELSRPIGRVLGVRSRGIRDLDYGLGALQTRDGHEVMFHLVGSTIADHGSSWLNTTVGDGLVTPDSALADDTGKAQRVMFAQKHHMTLLNDPDVYLELEMVLRQSLVQKL